MMLYERGLRIAELGSLERGDIKFDNHGAVVSLNFKTKKPRYVRLMMAVEHLAKYRNDYPNTPKGDAPLFLSEQRNPIEYDAIRIKMKKIAQRGRRCGILL